MKFLFFLFVVLQAVIAFYLLQPMLLFLVYCAKKRLHPFRSPVSRPAVIEKDFDFAAIVTAHQDTRFIPPLVDSLLKQQYRTFHIYVVADACTMSDLMPSDSNFTVLKPDTEFNAKIKSIQFACENFVRSHDALVIFDSDNLVHPEYFSVLNKYFQQGYRAVQTQMLSKNTETVYSRLDSIGHIYHSFLERKMRMELGLSSHILGLGIAIDCSLYREIMYKDGLGGFDKKLQADLVYRIPQLAYAEEAIVYDEKVDDGKALEKQRTRWLFTYFHYFKTNWRLIKCGFKKRSFNLIYFGVIVLRPPLVIVVGSAIILSFSYLFVNPIMALVWAGILMTYVIAFILIVLTQSKQGRMGRALLFIPLFVLRQVKALFQIKSAGKAFLKTEHSKVLYIEDMLI